MEFSAGATLLLECSEQSLYFPRFPAQKRSKASVFQPKSTKVLWIDGWRYQHWMKVELTSGIQDHLQSCNNYRCSINNMVPDGLYTRKARSKLIGSFALTQSLCNESSLSVILGSECTDVILQKSVMMMCEEGRVEEAIQYLDIMDQRGFMADPKLYICLLQECSNKKALREGKQVHEHILRSGFKPTISLWNTLIKMYFKCGSIKDGRNVFDNIQEKNTFTWTIVIAGYTQQGKSLEALSLFRQMERKGMKPDEYTFVSILKACTNIRAVEKGRQIHTQILQGGYESNVFIANTLVDMYVKFGCISHARQVFDKMQKRDVISWTSMISGYAQKGQGTEALILFHKMEQEGVKPDLVAFLAGLKACTSIGDLEQGKRIHAKILNSGFASDITVGNTLIDMYSKCGAIDLAHQVFNKMTSKRNVVSWNAMIAGYALNQRSEKAFQLFQLMEQDGVKADEITCVNILKACSSIKMLEEIHAYINEAGFGSSVILGNALIDTYAKCGNINRGCHVFNQMPRRDVISWNTMISRYTEHGQGWSALELFQHMVKEGVKPDKVTFMAIIKACTSVAALDQGKLIHAQIIKARLELDVFMGSSLVDMYAKCGSLDRARQVFNQLPNRDVVAWNSMIAGYAQHGQGNEALILFQQMEQEGMQPDEVTFVSIINACTSIEDLEQGKQIHAHVVKSGFECNVFVGSTLIDMYAKCGSIENARMVFDKMPERDVVSWNAMIAGYAQHGQSERACKLFWQMERQGFLPGEASFVSVLKACSGAAALEKGKQIHAYIIKHGHESNIYVASSLVGMYARCGSLEHARQVFDEMPKRDLISWNTMIAGYSQNGCGMEVLQLVEHMQREGIKPDNVTCTSILSACSHAGLVTEGCDYFDSMNQDTESTLTDEHYACMVHLLGRAGHLEEAICLIIRMNVKPSTSVWIALLGACRMHGNLSLSKYAAESILELEPHSGAAFVLLSNVYAAVGRISDK